jgi:hypothetical protein
MTAAWRKPAPAIPIARPPAPANSSTLRIQKSSDSLCHSRGLGEFAFPNGENAPTHSAQRSPIPCISRSIALQLRLPKVNPRLGHPSQRTARVSVPETAVYENDLGFRAEHHVRSPRQPCDVKAVAITHGGHQFANAALRPCVLVPDKRHDLGPLFCRHCIHELRATRK